MKKFAGTPCIRRRLAGASAMVLLAGLIPAGAQAQDAALEEIVVTGFRGSLASAINKKRNENDIVDVINAEDIGKFPDTNLAESLQRIPGVSIDRDGGEGRSITVRGLSSTFTRVRLNGLEALATTGGKDGSGGANRGRGFDFQIFASELFNSLTVRKSTSAQTEEGSLGATVDLQTARPFDYNKFVFSASGKIGYNDLSKSKDPRGTLLISDTFADGKIGALFSVAYSETNRLEEGSSTGRWERGIDTIGNVPTTGANAGNGSATSNFLFGGGGVSNTPGNRALPEQSAWHPRIPRYGRLDYDQERLGSTAALQFQPFETTRITLDGLYANLKGTRQEQYLEAISFSRNTGAGGMGGTTVTQATYDDLGNLIKGTFNGVDIRTEQRRDRLETEFLQYSVGLDQEFTDTIRFKGLAGWSSSKQDNPEQTTLSLEAYNVQGYSYDYSGDKNLPAFNYGFDVTNPANYIFSPSTRLVRNGTILGDQSLIRIRPNKTDNDFQTLRGEFEWDAQDWVTLKAGLAHKDYKFETQEWRRYGTLDAIQGSGNLTEAAVALPAGTNLASLTELVSGFGRNLDVPTGTPTSWIVPSIDKFEELLGFYCNCVNQYGDFRVAKDGQGAIGNNRNARERSLSAFIQADFNTELGDMPFRGNVGLRQVKTKLTSTGYVGTTLVTKKRDYTDTLPAINLSLEPIDDFLVRFGAAKVMSRPDLPNLTPGGSITNASQTISVGNPDLNPIRANTVDLSFEWYPEKETLVTVGFFYKDIKSYIQNISEQMTFAETGLPESLLANNNRPDTTFTVTRAANTNGGPLKGFEISLQKPFTFLPAPFDDFGGIVNFTYVTSDIDYRVGTRTVREPLVGLSPKSFNATLYYENDDFSARVSGSFRDEYLTQISPGNANDIRGKASTFNLDFSASYNFSEQISVTFEAINLTDEFDERWVGTSERQNSEEYVHYGRQFFLGAKYKY
ncbi:TonB-dependent receptor [Niveispirillum sp.]|uniref:TonB-dependent receptor n=1 Tax=Niveispirillum sp. TaxID=1917217 RepID=UPI001B749521|nr:TonB-dependent receptor [Niveispirillum sp.]MBP7336647.1 TonB-dependent receptor [Niveispirillum sp.]